MTINQYVKKGRDVHIIDKNSLSVESLHKIKTIYIKDSNNVEISDSRLIDRILITNSRVLLINVQDVGNITSDKSSNVELMMCKRVRSVEFNR
jgi:hypothetical protein